MFGGGFALTFRIDADNRLCIGFAEMHPFIGEVNFYTIDCVDFFVLIFGFDSVQNGVNIHFWVEFDSVFADEIVGITKSQLRTCFFRFRQMT